MNTVNWVIINTDHDFTLVRKVEYTDMDLIKKYNMLPKNISIIKSNKNATSA